MNNLPVKKLLCLPPIDPDFVGKPPKIMDSFAIVSDLSKKIENVGQGYAKLQGKFFRAHQRKNIADGKDTDKKGKKIVVEDSEESEEEKKSGEGEGDEEDYSKKRKKRTKEDIQREALLMEDLYATLGLEQTYEASSVEIKKAYGKVSLICHPDKLGDKYGEDEKATWLKIQNAYETLSDPARRKKYDSSLPFDESIPKEGTFTDKDFLEVFGKCFHNNSRFSVVKPCPTLGDKDTDIDDVYKFY